MMPLDHILQTFPNLQDHLEDDPFLNDSGKVWDFLRHLMRAHAPSSGASLPGSIHDDILAIMAVLKLTDNRDHSVDASGNLGFAVGANKSQADIVIVAHMDRPSFKLLSLDDGTLYPICANRYPQGEYITGAKSVRFDGKKLVLGAQGKLISRRDGDQKTLHMEVESGELAWQDTILMDAEPVSENGYISGTGLDNCQGVVTVLLAANILQQMEKTLKINDQRCLFVLTDLEEGPPDGFFGYGAARLTHLIPPPTIGYIVCDAQNTGEPDHMAIQEMGAGHGVVSGRGKGAVVAPNYQTLALQLSEQVNALRPDTVQMNFGYLSRSDDMALGHWSRPLGMIGAPLLEPHTDEETLFLDDMISGAWWLVHYLAAILVRPNGYA